MPTELQDKHLADLHALASELGIDRYRMLRREELVEKIGEEQARAAREAEKADKPRRLFGRRRRKRKEEEQKAEAPPPPAPEPEPEREPAAKPKAERAEKPAREKAAKDAPTTPVGGTLEVMPQRYGFIRLNGIEPGKADVYVSASQIRRCQLRAGDRVEGPAREPRRGERHPALVRVETVNGEPMDDEGSDGRPDFEQLTPVPPERPLELTGDAADRLAGLSFGQRVLVTGGPDAGGAAFLREVAGGLPKDTEVMVLLIDEPPEAVAGWGSGAGGAEVIAVPADRRPVEQARIARLALNRAKRGAESGKDVVMLVDSLSRLALTYRDPVEVKSFFAAGRELEEEGAGSLTMIATALTDTGVESDETVYGAVFTTENLLVELSS